MCVCVCVSFSVSNIIHMKISYIQKDFLRHLDKMFRFRYEWVDEWQLYVECY